MADLPSSTLEEAPVRFGPWRRQRTRWIKGFVQTLITHTRHPVQLLRDAGLAKGGALLALCAGTVLSALSYPFFLIATLAAIFVWGAPVADSFAGALLIGLWGALFVAGLVAIYAPVILGARRRGLTDLWTSILLKPVYCCVISVAAWAALLELITAPTRWNKTDHGLARTSRSARDVTQPHCGPAP